MVRTENVSPSEAGRKLAVNDSGMEWVYMNQRFICQMAKFSTAAKLTHAK